MAQRLLRIVVPSGDEEKVRKILEEEGTGVPWAAPAVGGLVAVEVVVPSEGNEPILDALQGAFEAREGFRILMVPLTASLPRLEEDEEDEADEREEKEEGPGEGGERGEGEGREAKGESEEGKGEAAKRISREELYVRIKDMSELSVHHIALVVLSTIIACVGLVQDSSPVVVAAMVIAPVIGPSLALSLATTLGDLQLGRDALVTGAAGVLSVLLVAAAWGAVGNLDPSGEELIRVSRMGYPELALALAAGVAGVVSISRGTDTALVGVMVAVALLPPAAAAGLLLGSGLFVAASGALGVLLSNLICINLAGVATFLAQGVRPRSWWEEDRARHATRVAVVTWTLLLVLAGVVISLL